MRKAEGFARRPTGFAGRRHDPHEAVLLDDWEGVHAPGAPVDLVVLRQSRDGATRAAPVELPAVVAALEDTVAHVADRERRVAVRTTVEHGGGAAMLPPEQGHRCVEDGSGDRPVT